MENCPLPIVFGQGIQIVTLMLRFNPECDMHWLRTKQNRE